jgi:hypothetical protein
MRTFFIPGFGEEPDIFEALAPGLPGPQVGICNHDLMGSAHRASYDVKQHAAALIAAHQITVEDLLIGHSMGGWIAYAVKQQVGCRIVQLGSWTDQAKVMRPVDNQEVVHWMVRNGLYFNWFNQVVFTWRGYRGLPSAPIFARIFQHLRDSPQEYVVNQLRVILTPVEFDAPQAPDLRLHAWKDRVIAPPDEPFVVVPGDHFSLATHPDAVLGAMKGVAKRG